MLDNPQLKLAHDYVQWTGQNVFLTGKAGTGKTTFLHSLRGRCSKRMIVVAPTGVAAMNAGGVTIHSFFQMPFGPLVPSPSGGPTDSQGQSIVKQFNRDKVNIIRGLDLLVIDEISMVRADLLDGIDAVLRHYKDARLPFGGVQLLMIGDLQQLAPVIKRDDWAILREFYETGFFFDSRALQEGGYVGIELKHIYRQSDQRFIDLLNNVRENRMDRATCAALNERCRRDYIPGDKEGVITLTTHNAQAQRINDTKLNDLSTKVKTFKAKVSDDFPMHIYPTDAQDAFAHGQVYVALSRCRTLEGLVLSTPITPQGVKSNAAISSFSNAIEESQPGPEQLTQAKHAYQQELLVNLFDFEGLHRTLQRIIRRVGEQAAALPENPVAWFESLDRSLREQVTDIGGKFHQQIRFLTADPTLDFETHELLQERVQKGGAYFRDRIKDVLLEPLRGLVVETDNQAVRKSVEELIDRFTGQVEAKLTCLAACDGGFFVKTTLKVRAEAGLEAARRGKRKVNLKQEKAVATEHPELYLRLKAWRREKAEQEEMSLNKVLALKAMISIANQLPRSRAELRRIKGIGAKTLRRIGDDLLAILTEYEPGEERPGAQKCANRLRSF